MAPRRKSTTTTEPPVHMCGQEQCIGEINARLDGQEKTDERIEAAVLNLIDQNTKERQNNAKEFEKVRIELTKLTTIMENGNKNNERSIENQTEMLKQLAQVAQSTSLIQQKQETFQNTIDIHVAESNAWKKDIEKRVTSLERFKYAWYVMGVGVLAVLSGLAYVAAVVDVFNDAPRTEQVAPSNK